ncbi:protocadherin 2 gamma 28 isoform X14 [Alosa sapidissima]|uniref:protocadherin 2 gamma 28 isoform X14 n=1 Tax=Alosa sapidissima TaxID=34773 RepID=UPI001C089918|nr:protocadherin 2 gamma 28 isoform X14 [Alosa sapidissima]
MFFKAFVGQRRRGFPMREKLLVIILLCAVHGGFGQIRYSIPEEMKKGSFVGNLAEDLGLDVRRMRSGGARIVGSENSEFITLDSDKGTLVVGERIDREQLCRQTSPCSLNLEIIMLNPMQLHSVIVEILDVNDNAPFFTEKEIKLEISESTPLGTPVIQESAVDPDVGTNALRGYTVHPTDKFNVKVQDSPDGNKYAEVYLQGPLDREKEDQLLLTLTAFDGGDPQRSGIIKIHITVLDANDNAPIFIQPVFKATVTENSPKGAVVTTVSATDADAGTNSHITYHFSRMSADVAGIFAIDETTGEIRVDGPIDYEKNKYYEFGIQAKDQGGLIASGKVAIDIVDVNDNPPLITLTSFSKSLSEDSEIGTTVAIISVKDIDSSKNGKVDCSINPNIPFAVQSSLKNYYTLVTNSDLNRELQAEYNITFTAVDEGTPPLYATKTVTLKITDVNDNPPLFEKSLYSAHLMENNSPGLSIFSVKAIDLDSNQNARISYLLIDSQFNGNPVSSYISVNSESGVIHAVRSLDFEQINSVKFCISAQDGGSPPLSSNTTVIINILDQNDNAPQILYPVQSSSMLVGEVIPRSADVGYLVTKVVAVDVDSGQNAWLSYKFLKMTERALFEVGTQNGEIRTIRQVTDKDAVKQKLTVVVEDNGQPPRSATVSVNVMVADSFPEVLSEFNDYSQDTDYNDNLTFYLILALAVVSFLFIVSLVAIISVKIYRWRQSRLYYQSKLPVIPYYPPRYADAGATGTLQHVYNYEVYRTMDSRKSDCQFARPESQNVLILDQSSAGTLQRVHSEKNILDEPDSPIQQKPPNQDWRFNQNQRPGPSGAAATPEVAVGTGPWPNPPTEAEQLQALMAAANGASHTSSPPLYSSPRSCLLISEVSEATNTLTPGTMGLSTRYSPQFTLQHVPDYRQNVYIPGSTATLTSNPQQQQQQQLQLQQQMLPNMPPQQALPPAQATGPDGAAGGGAPGAQSEPPKAAQTPASKKKSTKKEKK